MYVLWLWAWQIVEVLQMSIAKRSLGTTYAGHLAWRRQADVVVMLRNTSKPHILQFFEHCGPSVMMSN